MGRKKGLRVIPVDPAKLKYLSKAMTKLDGSLVEPRSNRKHIESLIDALRDCIADKLSEKQREAVYMYWFEGMTQQEIAHATKTSQQAVCLRLYGATRKLRKCLGKLVEKYL